LFFLFCFVLFFGGGGGIGVWTQVLALAGKHPSPLTMPPSPFFFCFLALVTF
jgi:hypothetical protein